MGLCDQLVMPSTGRKPDRPGHPPKRSRLQLAAQQPKYNQCTSHGGRSLVPNGAVALAESAQATMKLGVICPKALRWSVGEVFGHIADEQMLEVNRSLAVFLGVV